MKIAMIGHKKVPSRLGGVEIHVEEIGARLAAKGHEVDVYNRAVHGFEQTNYRGMNLKYINAYGKRGIYALIYSTKAALAVSVKDYDIIHFHALGPTAAGIIPLIVGKNLVSTVHGLDWKRSKWNKAAVLFLKMGEWVAGRLFHRTIVVSEPLTSYFQKKYKNHHRFIYIPNGIDIQTVQSQPEQNTYAKHIRREYGVESGDYYLFVSRLVPEKACHTLLEAFKHVRTNKKLIIVGDNPEDKVYVKRLERMAQDDLRVRMIGFKGMEELIKLYTHAFCYILPSEVEGLPISLLEAMSHGCFCLTSDIKENKTVLNDFGRTFRAEDVRDLQKSLQSIEKESGTISEEYGQGSKGLHQIKHMRETYNWDEVAEQTEQVYINLLKIQASQNSNKKSLNQGNQKSSMKL